MLLLHHYATYIQAIRSTVVILLGHYICVDNFNDCVLCTDIMTGLLGDTIAQLTTGKELDEFGWTTFSAMERK